MAYRRAPVSSTKKGSTSRPQSSQLVSYERSGITDEEIDEMREAFTLFDTSGNGTIELKELKSAMISLNFDTKNQTIFQMILDMEHNGMSTLRFDDFLDLMTAKMSDKDTREDINKIFNMFDDDHTGGITVRNLRKVAKELGENISEAELTEMIERADSDNDGIISAEDFYAIMTKKIAS